MSADGLDRPGALDLSPRPGAAPFPRMVLAQAAMEARLMLRNGEQLLLAVVIPVIVLVGGVTGARHIGLHFAHRPVDVFTPGVLALAVMSTSFTSLAIATGFERRYGVIKRLGSSPLPRSGLLAAVTSWCAGQGMMPDGLTVGRATLEDVFLQLTGRELRA